MKMIIMIMQKIRMTWSKGDYNETLTTKLLVLTCLS